MIGSWLGGHSVQGGWGGSGHSSAESQLSPSIKSQALLCYV